MRNLIGVSILNCLKISSNKMKILNLILISFFVFILPCRDLHAKRYIAFSLKKAQSIISSLPESEDVKKNFPDLFRLFGINNIEGAVYDKKDQDIIIIGSIDHDTHTPSFNLEDLVIALRSVFVYGREPYVSLEPGKYGKSLDVYIEDGIKKTQMGKELLDIGLSVCRISKDILHTNKSTNLLLISLVPEVRVKKDVLTIRGLDEYLFANSDKTKHVLQKKLKASLFPRLRAISQLVALAQGMEQMDIDINKADLWFWLKRYKIRQILIPKNITLDDKHSEISCAIKALGIILHTKKMVIKKLKKSALRARAKKEDISWSFEAKNSNQDEAGLSEDMEKAIRLFSEAMYLYNTKKSFYEALEHYTRLIETGPDWDLPYYLRATIYNELKQYKKAIKDYERAIEINPRYPMSYINQGYTYNYMSRYKKAIKALNKAIEISPYHIDAYNNRGIAYCGIGKYKKGIMDFDNVIKIAPDFALAYVNKGKAYFCLGEYKKAIGVLSKAIEKLPDFSEAYCNRGIAYRYLGEYKSAIQDFNKAIQIDPYYAYAYVQRGLTYEDLCQWKRADMDIEKAVQLDPHIFSTYIFGVIRLNPRTAVEYHERGHAFFCIGQWKKAIADFDKAIQLRPGFASAYFYRGLSYDNLKDYKKAISDYTQAIKLIPTDPLMYNNRGTAYYSCHEYENALRDFNEAIKLEPKNAMFYENRVRVYSRLGKNKEACKDAHHACELGRCRFYHTLIKRGICRQKEKIH